MHLSNLIEGIMLTRKDYVRPSAGIVGMDVVRPFAASNVPSVILEVESDDWVPVENEISFE